MPARVRPGAWSMSHPIAAIPHGALLEFLGMRKLSHLSQVFCDESNWSEVEPR